MAPRAASMFWPALRVLLGGARAFAVLAIAAPALAQDAGTDLGFGQGDGSQLGFGQELPLIETPDLTVESIGLQIGLTLEQLQQLPGGTGQADMAPVKSQTQEAVVRGLGGMARALDRVSGEVGDLELSFGKTARFGRIDITLSDCRYPADNPSGNAYGYLTVQNWATGEVAFQGWMIAAAPALNALDHMRYDVWMTRCVVN